MEATTPPVVRLRPSDLGDFNKAFELFVRVMAAVAARRGEAGFVPRLGLLAVGASTAVREQITWDDARAVLGESLAYPAERISVQLLVEEMEYYAWRYRAALPEVQQEIKAGVALWGNGVGDVLSPAAVDNAETIVGSVEKILDKLPGPLKKALHGLLEALKLTRGIL